MTFSLTLQDIKPVTHDTYQLTFDRPDGYDFEVGQATHFALDQPGWKDEDRPFTMTSLPQDKDRLEFVIKSYPSHDGVTERIPALKPGAKVIAEAPAGAITDHGPGTFIAGGAGVTPFIAILRSHAQKGAMDCHLIFANKTDKDIILQNEFDAMEGLKTSYLISDQDDTDHISGKPDKEMLSRLITDFAQTFYVCGPQEMVNAVRDALKELGASDDKIITEEGW